MGISSTLTNNFGVFSANAVASTIAEGSVYLYVGRPYPEWSDDDSPDGASATIHSINGIWNNMAGMIKVTPDKIRLGTSRNDWVSGQDYPRWDHANTSLSTDYVVLAGVEDRDVYICLDNNGGSISTSKPIHKNLGVTREVDGYAWKYMYSIPDTDFRIFASSEVIPVYRNQDVSSFSKPGSIIHVPITASKDTGIGQFYRGLGFANTSYSVSAANATIYNEIPYDSPTTHVRIIADSGLALQDNYYNNSAFLVTSGKAKGTYRRIVESLSGGYSGDVGLDQDRVTNLTLSSSVSNISNGDTFIIGPQIVITEDKYGTGFLGIGNTNRYGNVTSIDVSLIGTGYSNGLANVFINGEYHPTSQTATITPDGSGADTRLILPPAGGGHGYNPYMELNADHLIVAPETPTVRDHETGVFAGHGNQIMQAGLIKDPIDTSTGLPAFAPSYDTRTTIYFGSGTVITFKEDQTIYNSLETDTETASGTVWDICNSGGSNPYLSLINVAGQFANGNVLYNRQGQSHTITSSHLTNSEYPLGSGTSPKNSVMNGNIAKYTGEILYVENFSSITRRVDQKENFRFILRF